MFNENLQSLRGLDSLTNIGRVLEIVGNPKLQTFWGLNTLTVENYIYLSGNPKLIELSLPIDINIKARGFQGRDGFSLSTESGKFFDQDAFTNYPKSIELFKDRYNPRIHSEWDVTQILRRVLEYGTDKTVTDVIEHLNSKVSGQVEKLLPKIESKYQERYYDLYNKK